MGTLSIIEITGVTGSGKTSFITKIERLSSQANYKMAIVNEYGIYSKNIDNIKNQYFFKNINNSNSIFRSLLIDLIVIPQLFNYRSIKLLFFIIKNILLSSENSFSKINILRNAAKRIGLYNKLNKLKSNSDLDYIFLDEGILHIAHNIFVNDFAKPNINNLNTFISNVPLYDSIIFMNSNKENLISVLTNRNHKRVKNNKYSINNYVDNAITVFNHMMANTRIMKKLIKIKRNDLKSPDDLQSLLIKTRNN